MEDELPDYDADDEDEKWLEQFNKNHPDTPVQMLDLERIFDTLEKSCSSRIDVRICLLYTSPSPRDKRQSRMPSSA